MFKPSGLDTKWKKRFGTLLKINKKMQTLGVVEIQILENKIRSSRKGVRDSRKLLWAAVLEKVGIQKKPNIATKKLLTSEKL